MTTAPSSFYALNTPAFQSPYYGVYPADPLADPLGRALQMGALYYNSTSLQLKSFNGTVWVAGTATIPGGASGQVQWNNGGVFAGLTVSGDGTLVTSSGVLTVTKTNGVSFATSATTDTTNAANITSGTLLSGRFPALSGDVTTTAGSIATTISAGVVTLAKMANLAANSVIGNNTGSPATPIALTQAQLTAMVNTFTSTLSGAVAASGGGTVNFLRADGTWAAPSGGSGSPGGTNTQLQYNNAGAFGGIANVTSDGTNLTGVRLKSTTSLDWDSGAAAVDVSLFRDAASILAQRVGATAQTLRVYNTFTDASNYERGVLDWTTTANTLKIGSQAAGTGTARNVNIIGATTTAIVSGVALDLIQLDFTTGPTFANTGSIRWEHRASSLITVLNQTAGNGGEIQLGATAQAGGNGGGYFNVGGANCSVVGASGTTATGLHIYNTIGNTVDTNYERLVLDWTTSTNVATLGTKAGGTGSNRALLLTSSIGASLNLATAKVAQFGDGAANTNGWMQWAGQTRVTADVTYTSNATLANVAGLTTNVQAGRTYSFEAQIIFTEGATAGGIQVAIGGTCTATSINYQGVYFDGVNIRANSLASALGTGIGGTGTATGGLFTVIGTITVNAAGTLTVQAAQNVSNATSTVIKRGSWFMVQDMP